MMESKVFADNFSRSFSESGDFFQFLSARQARSKWMTAPSKELRFEPVERGSTLGNLYMQIYDHNGDADVLEDTMENTSLLLKVDGKDYPVRSCLDPFICDQDSSRARTHLWACTQQSFQDGIRRDPQLLHGRCLW